MLWKRCFHEIFCQKNARVYFCNFHTVHRLIFQEKPDCPWWYWWKSRMTLDFFTHSFLIYLLQEIVDLYFTAIKSVIPFDCYFYSHVKKDCLFHFITLSGSLSINAVCYDDCWQPWIKSWWCSVPRVGTFKYRATKMKSKVEKIHNKQLKK